MSECLLLNASFEPLDVINLKRAVGLLYARKAEVIHATQVVLHSEKLAFPLPSVLRLLYYVVRGRKTVALTKKNVLLRDQYRCAYCGGEGGREMTVDHVQPRSRGGSSSWKNLVACCSRCNARKRDRTPEEAGMVLQRKPHVPKMIPWIIVKRHTLPDEWAKYLYWSISIDERQEAPTPGA